MKNGNSSRVRQIVVGDSFARAVTILIVGLAGGGGLTGTLLAQPRSDADIRKIAKEVVADEQRVVDLKVENLSGAIDRNTRAVADLGTEFQNLRTIILQRLPATP